MMKRKSGLTIIVRVFTALLLMAGNAITQTNQTALTRGKFWFETYEAGFPIGDGNIVEINGWAYPGYFQAEKNSFMHSGAGAGLIAVRNDTTLDFSWNFKIYQEPWEMVTPVQLIKNYNFYEQGVNFPEEIVYGAVRSTSIISEEGFKGLRFVLRSKSRCWSLPRYDDFVITDFTIISEETVPLYNVFFMEVIPMLPTKGGRAQRFDNDKEYIWDEEREIFIFYDDSSIPLGTGEPVVYDIEPGKTTGDVGDPGNIRYVGSIDYELYSPQALAMAFIHVPPNVFGESKVDYQISNTYMGTPRSHPATPPNEYTGYTGGVKMSTHMHNPDPDNPTTPLPSIFLYPQALVSYRDAVDNPSTTDGNIWERSPMLAMAIGPYELQPGDSISWTRIMCAGEIDRTESMLGGLEATKQLDLDYVSVDEHASIKKLRENWDAALELIENNYVPAAVPPPTVGNPPRIGYGDELEAEVFLKADKAGVELRWIPVPEDYVDPLTGQPDFDGYRVYRSSVALEGPWRLFAEISAQEAKSLIKNGRVAYEAEIEPGIPFRFGVTSFDTQGLESGMTAYTFDAYSAKRAPSNNAANVRVVPNPFKQASGFPDVQEYKRLTFIHIPAICTIRIYNLAGDLIQVIEHDDGLGEEAWGSSIENDYMGSQYYQNVMPGLYIYHITSHVAGHEGETATGKFVIIK
jgi:hypothetical protein